MDKQLYMVINNKLKNRKFNCPKCNYIKTLITEHEKKYIIECLHTDCKNISILKFAV